MFTARPQKNVKQAKLYFRQHLKHGDYYSEGETVAGMWIGKGCERLGLDLRSPITAEQYDRLCENRHPLLGTQLTVRKRVANHRVFHDFACSAPKSASIEALIAGDQRILLAHDEAAGEAIHEMEKAAQTRVRTGGQRKERTTGEIVGAVFRHDSSRSLDPQVHTHFLIFNATWDPVEKRWKALETKRMFEQIKYFTAVFQNALARRLIALGYGIEKTAHGFEIAGVPPEIIARFSKRRRDILAAEPAALAAANRKKRAELEAAVRDSVGQSVKVRERAERALRDFRPLTKLTKGGRALLARSTRAKKETKISAAELLAQQRSQLSPAELAKLQALAHPSPKTIQESVKAAESAKKTKQLAQPRFASDRESQPQTDSASDARKQPPAPPEDHQGAIQGLLSPEAAERGDAGGPPPPSIRITATQAIDYARDHLFERHSVVPIKEMLRQALNYGRGQVQLKDLECELALRDEFIVVDNQLTTRETLQQEKRLVSLVNSSLGSCQPLQPDFVGDAGLNEDQRRALQFMLRAPDQIIGLRGGAGTGKTHLLKELIRGIEQKHATVVLAPTTAAVQALRDEGCTKAATVQRFLRDEKFQQEVVGKVLIIDEAGLLSRRDMLAVLEFVRSHPCRLVLAGDTRQHSGVEAGDALRLLEQRSALRPVEVNRIQRQLNQEYRAAVADLAQGKGMEALTRLEKLGAVTVSPAVQRYQQLAAEYFTSVQRGKSALVVSPTWGEIKIATTEIRKLLQQSGKLAREETDVTVHRRLKWTRAQKRDLRNYQSGQVVAFYRSTRQFAAGEWATVTEVQPNALVVQRHDGRQGYLTRKQAECFDVAEVVTLPVAPGERLLLQDSYRPQQLFNGQMVTVQQVKANGTIVLTDKRELPPMFKAFTHGYCVTSHAAQGRTVDHVIVALDTKSHLSTHLNQFYVSTSRGREQVKIFTDNVDELRVLVRRSGARLSATELLGFKQSVNRRNQVQRTAVGAALKP